jgi:hypothetical protein
MLLTRDQILAAPEAASVFEDVPVPEWGGVARVKALSGAERDRYEASLATQRGKKMQMDMTNARARLVAIAVIDEAGQPLFSPRDAEALGEKSAAALDRVFDAAMRLAGMKATDLEELTGNFTPGPNGDSTTD